MVFRGKSKKRKAEAFKRNNFQAKQVISNNFIINDIGHLQKESIGLVRLRESKGLLNYSSKVMERRHRTQKKKIIICFSS